MLEKIDELFQTVDKRLKFNEEIVNDYLDFILDYNAIKNKKNRIIKEITDKITEPNLRKDLLNKVNFLHEDMGGMILDINDELRKLTLYRTSDKDYEKALYHRKKGYLLENKDEALKEAFYLLKSGYTYHLAREGIEKATEYIGNKKKNILANPHMPQRDQKKHMEMCQDIIKGTTPVWL